VVDITVFGEVTIDVLDQRYCRPGGIAYSALAGRCVGASTAVGGYVGSEATSWMRFIFSSREVDHRYLLAKDRPTTTFYINGSDEVEAPAVCRQDSGFPLNGVWPDNFETRALLAYACPSETLHEVISRCPGALICYDLQYDMGPQEELEAVLKRCNVVFVSRSQAVEYFGIPKVSDLARYILQLGPSVVVIKCGLSGSLVFSKDGEVHVPRFCADWQQSVGAGDVYNAVFIAKLLEGSDLTTAGESAAAATAAYCEGHGDTLLKSWDLQAELQRDRFFLHPDSRTGRHIYLAAPFFDWSERTLVQRTKALLEHHGYRVYSPFDEDGILYSHDVMRESSVFGREKKAIEEALAVVSLLDGNDPGTMWEIGFAVGCDVPVISLWTADYYSLNLMPRMSTTVVNSYQQLVLELLEVTRQCQNP